MTARRHKSTGLSIMTVGAVVLMIIGAVSVYYHVRVGVHAHHNRVDITARLV